MFKMYNQTRISIEEKEFEKLEESLIRVERKVKKYLFSIRVRKKHLKCYYVSIKFNNMGF